MGRIERAKDLERQVSFTIAIVSLGAKLAKADGNVSAGEIRAFRTVFRIERKDERAAGRVFDLARKSTIGFETHARSIARAFAREPEIREQIMEGLFHIATADSHLSEPEIVFLFRVNEIFGLSETSFDIRVRKFDGAGKIEPYQVLGIEPTMSTTEIRKRWKALMRTNHPDLLVARGMPIEAIRLAEQRVAEYNDAWNQIRESRDEPA